MLGLGLGVASPLQGGVSQSSDWTPATIFLIGGSGFWAGGFAPAPWTPDAAFTTGAGFWLGGVQPRDWTPADTFTTGDGFWPGGFKQG